MFSNKKKVWAFAQGISLPHFASPSFVTQNTDTTVLGAYDSSLFVTPYHSRVLSVKNKVLPLPPMRRHLQSAHLPFLSSAPSPLTPLHFYDCLLLTDFAEYIRRVVADSPNHLIRDSLQWVLPVPALADSHTRSSLTQSFGAHLGSNENKMNGGKFRHREPQHAFSHTAPNTHVPFKPYHIVTPASNTSINTLNDPSSSPDQRVAAGTGAGRFSASTHQWKSFHVPEPFSLLLATFAVELWWAMHFCDCSSSSSSPQRSYDTSFLGLFGASSVPSKKQKEEALILHNTFVRPLRTKPLFVETGIKVMRDDDAEDEDAAAEMLIRRLCDGMERVCLSQLLSSNSGTAVDDYIRQKEQREQQQQQEKSSTAENNAGVVAQRLWFPCFNVQETNDLFDYDPTLVHSVVTNNNGAETTLEPLPARLIPTANMLAAQHGFASIRWVQTSSSSQSSQPSKGVIHCDGLVAHRCVNACYFPELLQTLVDQDVLPEQRVCRGRLITREVVLKRPPISALGDAGNAPLLVEYATLAKTTHFIVFAAKDGGAAAVVVPASTVSRGRAWQRAEEERSTAATATTTTNVWFSLDFVHSKLGNELVIFDNVNDTPASTSSSPSPSRFQTTFRLPKSADCVYRDSILLPLHLVHVKQNAEYVNTETALLQILEKK